MEHVKTPTMKERAIALVMAGALAGSMLAVPMVTLVPDTAMADPAAMQPRNATALFNPYYAAVDLETAADLLRQTGVMSDEELARATAEEIYETYYIYVLYQCTTEMLEAKNADDAVQDIYDEMSSDAEGYINGNVKDPAFMETINQYAPALYDFCEEAGVLDEKVIAYGFELKDTADLIEQWQAGRFMGQFEHIGEPMPGGTYWESNFDYNYHDEVPDFGPTWRDIFTFDPASTDEAPWAGAQTGEGATDLTMIVQSPREHGGTAEPITIPVEEGTGHYNEDGTPQEGGDYELNPAYNPDEDYDGLGNNLAFTTPSSINFVLKADGTLIGPSNVYVENRSAMPIHTSSLKVKAEDGWNLVEDAAASTEDNSVDVQIGPTSASMQDLSGFLDTKKAVTGGADWNMAATDTTPGSGNDALPLDVQGDASHVTKDVTSRQKFAEIRWYMTSGEAS